MNGILDDLLVGLVLVAACGYAIYSLGPKSWRGPLLVGMASLLGRLPAFVGLRGLGQRLDQAARSKSKGSCGGCDNCGSDEPAQGQAQTTSSEVRIPLAKIRKRR